MIEQMALVKASHHQTFEDMKRRIIIDECPKEKSTLVKHLKKSQQRISNIPPTQWVSKLKKTKDSSIVTVNQATFP